MDNNPFASMAEPSISSNNNNNPFTSMTESAEKSAQQNNPQSNQPKQSTFMDMVDVVNRNFANVANGQLQFMAQGLSKLGLDTSGFQQGLSQNQATHERDYQAAMKNSPVAGTITDIGSSIGAAVATPGTQPFLAAGGANVAGRMLGTGAASAVVGGSEYVDPGESRIDNATRSGLLGGLTQGVAEGAGELIKKGASKLFTTPVQEAADSANKGLLTTMGSATGNKALQGAEDVLGRIPIAGAKRGINKQVNALKQETQSVLDDIGVGGSQTEKGIQLEGQIKNAKDIITKKVDSAYSKSFKTAEESGINIPLTSTVSVAQTALQDAGALQKAGIASADISGSKAGKLLNDIANLKSGEVPASVFEKLRRQVGGLQTSLAKGADDEGLYPVIKSLKKSMDEDLDSLANTAGGKFGRELKEARTLYSTEKAPFKDIPILAKSTTGELDTDQLLKQIVQGERPQLTSKIMGVLTPEGKKSFTQAIVGKALTNATSKTEGLDLGAFSTQIHKLGETITALPKDERLKVEGLQRLLTRGDNLIKTGKLSINNLGTYLSGFGTAVAAIAGGSVAGAVATVAPFAALAKGLSWALTSPKMTKQLIKLAGGKLAQTGQDGIIKSALKTMIRVGSIPAASAEISND